MNLIVKIPKRFKEGLDFRFNPENAKRKSLSGIYLIETPCPLCEEFIIVEDYIDCGECPFQKFEIVKKRGCKVWVEKVLGKEPSFGFLADSVLWREDEDKEARIQLEFLREQAQKLIEWED